MGTESFGDRVRRAREVAGLSQEALAMRLHIKQQAIGYLENPANNARGSRYTAEIARACGVDVNWLATGSGPAPGSKAEQTVATYGLDPEAMAIARTWSALPKHARTWVQQLLALLGGLDEKQLRDRRRVLLRGSEPLRSERSARGDRRSAKKD